MSKHELADHAGGRLCGRIRTEIRAQARSKRMLGILPGRHRAVEPIITWEELWSNEPRQPI